MDLQNFMDAEYCIDKYFEKHLKERLDFYIDSRNAALVAGRSTGFGITNALAPSEDYATNVTLNFPAKDIEKLGAELQRDKGMSHDIEVLTQAWRKAAVAQVGEARYQELSQKLGGREESRSWFCGLHSQRGTPFFAVVVGRCSDIRAAAVYRQAHH